MPTFGLKILQAYSSAADSANALTLFSSKNWPPQGYCVNHQTMHSHSNVQKLKKIPGAPGNVCPSLLVRGVNYLLLQLFQRSLYLTNDARVHSQTSAQIQA